MPAVYKFLLFLFLLPQSLQVSNVSTKRLCERSFVVVSDTKLLARLTHNRSYLWIVNLTHSRKQVMSGLMIQGTCEGTLTLLRTAPTYSKVFLRRL